jgi:hypothetical protein
MSANASKSAANAQAGAARDATEAEREMFERQVQLQEPWRQGGGLGLNALLYGMGLSPTGTFAPGATGAAPAMLQPGADSVFAPAGAPSAELESPEQIRARLAPQFPAAAASPAAEPDFLTNLRQLVGGPAPTGGRFVTEGSGTNMSTLWVPNQATSGTAASSQALDAAVAQEIERQRAAQQQQTAAIQQAAAQDPKYGGLLRDFSMADYQADPGLAFRLEEGEKGLARAAAAQGGFGSGRYLKDAMRFNSGLASQEYGNANARYTANRGFKLNALQSLAGVGQSATNQMGAAAGAFGSQMGSNIIGAGNAQAAGRVGAANALNGAIGQGVSMYQQNQLMNRFQTPYFDSGAGISPPNPYYVG